ncbi:MAG: SAM-dependent methyltransferase, partial [Chloroflexota bacterium]
DLIFFDPARRNDEGKRIFDVERYQPPLATIRGWKADRIDVKLSPGVDLTQLQPYVEEGASVSFVSVDGELKEALLSIDDNLAAKEYHAVLLSHDPSFPQARVYSRSGDTIMTAPISAPRGWLVEPDPALIRAGLVANVALDLNGALLDPEIAYITTDERPRSAWVRAWQIIDWMPFNLKKLRAYLREHDVGTVTVKKRGTAVTPEELIAKLRLNGSGSGTIVLTRCRGEHIILVCKDLTIE